jgi:hypothetical protein
MSDIAPQRFLTVPRPRLTKFKLEIQKPYYDEKKTVHAIGKIDHIRIPLEFEVRVWRRGLKMRIGSDVKPGARWTFKSADGIYAEAGSFDGWLLPAADLPDGWEKWKDEEIIGVLICKAVGGGSLSQGIDYDEAAFPSLMGGVQSAPLEPYR